ncbi:DUF4268 domain-containing protein [Aureispira sp. CCB-E]|uniref:DUF4268 domain-containing protein n=1 Tax=Aureispira sp. CCB-E TaxID=3051121 RepID=UPI002868B405|nr:DUF4268 domain-containing protein [Aureispira sp. CCB-E]WMX16501.1 DUF4268 domain-containing protein [Aureispira sp. CCB-E]
MITPNGEIAIVETKLWRNSEARRAVIAQILDYAKELANWTYDDLQREINRKLKKKGNTLYKMAKEIHPDLIPNESDFVDSVSRNLSRGKFLLLIAGDGIREGAYSIAEFLTNAGHLNFSFAMVELNIFSAGEIGKLVLPKTIVKTVEIQKLTVEIPDGLVISNVNVEDLSNSSNDKQLSPEKSKERQFYPNFWTELSRELTFDDPGQPLPNPAQAQNLFLYPGKTKKAWISAYFMKSKKRVGVYFRTASDNEGREIFNFLDDYKDEIKEELGDDIIWTWDESNDVGIRFYCEDVLAKKNRYDIKEFFKEQLNQFVNVFRPRLKKFESDK